jgi:hypothetical protein
VAQAARQASLLPSLNQLYARSRRRFEAGLRRARGAPAPGAIHGKEKEGIPYSRRKGKKLVRIGSFR